MGASSQAGQVLLRTQAVKGAFAPDFATEHRAIKLRSGSLGPNRELLIPDPEIGGGRDVADAYLGAISWSGDLEFYARMESITTLLAAALGDVQTALEGTGAWRHTIEPSDASQLPFLSIEERIAADLETYQYYDSVVNTFHLESEADGYLMGTVGLIASRQTAGATPTAVPNWDNSPLIVGTNINVLYNSLTLPAKSFSLDINNNFEDDDFRLGSLFLNQLSPKRREITASVTIRPEDSALWRQAVYGSAVATTPGGLSTKQPLVITCETYELIAGSAPPVVGALEITLPNVLLQPFGLEPSGDDLIESDVEMQAVRPNPANPIGTFEVVNGVEDVA